MEFSSYLDTWFAGLKPVKVNTIIQDPKKTVLISVDMINGFCCEGPLASPRIKNIIPQVEKIFRQFYDWKVRKFLLMEDAHDKNAEEFLDYGSHCIKGTSQAQTVKELAELEFSDLFKRFEKNSLLVATGNVEFDVWLYNNPTVDTFVIVGNCTDLCVYQMAMYLRLISNAANRNYHIVVPETCVQTYDLPVGKALGPHDGDTFHALFLYHMVLNGIEVVKSIV